MSDREATCSESVLTWSDQRAPQAFGPEYWLGRCDGFRVVAKDGRQGEVDEIVEEHGVVQCVGVRWGLAFVRVDQAHITDVDPVARTVFVDEEDHQGGM